MGLEYILIGFFGITCLWGLYSVGYQKGRLDKTIENIKDSEKSPMKGAKRPRTKGKSPQ